MSQWCEHCQENRAEYKAYYRTDMYVAKWSTIAGEQFMSNVCLACFQELTRQERAGLIWSVGHRSTAGIEI
jgi:hypothetical protein